MSSNLIRALVLLPGTVTILIPGLLLWISQNSRWAGTMSRLNSFSFWVGAIFIIAGAALGIWATALFTTFGQGTPAPWDPPQKLVIRGPYRHVRNPMISGVIMLLTGEALFFQSLPLAVWTLIFFGGNAFYFPFVEEKSLIRRFGHDYRVYQKNVPRWLPRLRPWSGADEDRTSTTSD